MQETLMETADIVELGRCIRSIREASGLTAEQLAEAAGSITRPSLTRIEIGKAQAPAFDTLFRILRVIGGLSLVKNGEFDFRPYSKEVVDLVHYFVRDDKGAAWANYGNTASQQIAEACANWSKDELYPLIVYVQCKNGMDEVKRQAHKFSQTLVSKGLAAEGLDYKDATRYISEETYFAFQYRQFVLGFNQEARHDELYKFVGELFEKMCLYIESKYAAGGDAVAEGCEKL